MDDLDALLFVDTNIMLDFYRIRQGDVSLEYLSRLEDCEARLITGAQVEMEYKKNRQRVILESLRRYTSPDWEKLSTPPIVSSLQAASTIEKRKRDISNQQKKVSEKIEKVLKNPSSNDPVYQSLQRIFKNSNDYNLKRDKSRRFYIRRLARKRWVLGYPPRKDSDTSVGDAINWEWIIDCANMSGKDIIIVTRDSDFGVTYKGSSYINDWLYQEFKERVSRKRRIVLTDRLSVGLKAVHARVTQEMEAAEKEFLDNIAEFEDLLK